MTAHRACDALEPLQELEESPSRVQQRRCAQHGPVIVKRASGRAAEAEVNARRIADAIPGIHLPAVLAHRTDGETTYLELARADRSRATRTPDLLDAAHTLAKATADPAQRFDLAAAARERLDPITHTSGPTSRIAEALLADLPDRWEERPSFCHGDLHPSNVIPTRVGTFLVDWENSAWLTFPWELTKMAIVADLPTGSWDDLARQAGINPRQFLILARFHTIEGLHYAVERENRDHDRWRQRARRVGLASPNLSDR